MKNCAAGLGTIPRAPEGFQARCRRELEDAEHQAAPGELRERSRRGPLTLLFAAKDTAHCNAQVLRILLVAGQ